MSTHSNSSEQSPAHYFLNYRVGLAAPDGKAADIPVGGSVGLLALGDLGTIAWRQKLQQVKSDLAQRTQAHLANSQNEDSFTSKTSANGNK